MKTDIFCEILVSDPAERAPAEQALRQAFDTFRDFGQRYGRFHTGNDLWQLNQSEEAHISEELLAILEEAEQAYVLTEGLFDPSVLPALEREGYTGAYTSEATYSQEKIPFSTLRIDHDARIVYKPLGLKIDLGGIGKGFVIDKVAKIFSERYQNFLIDAGGDVVAHGANQVESYPYWAIEVENPANPDQSVALLCLSDQAVATSGRNRRRWMQDGTEKHHIIDPTTGRSARQDFLSVTVIAPCATEADTLAKALFIAGEERGIMMADTLNIPAIFVRSDNSVHINNNAMPYVWKK